jgi:hypothetical protein
MSALKNIVRVLFVFLLVFGMVGLAVQPAAAAGPEDGTAACTQYHTVKSGENLYQIGKLYGVKWQDLAKWNNIHSPYVIYTGQQLCVSTQGTVTPPPSQPPAGTIPTFSILSVVSDQNVTIQTANFPANDTFDVLMGKFGTQAIGGIKVDTINSGSGGTFKATFNIPAELKGLSKIAIRLQSNTGSGYFAYNWFYNNTTGSGTGGGDGTGGGYSGYPTFSIAGVVRNQTVTIVTNNLPKNDSFNVLMGPMGTRAVNGYLVTTINSGSGGTQTLTFNIPSQLSGSKQIAIRLESPTSGYFAYNWFYNNNA